MKKSAVNPKAKVAPKNPLSAPIESDDVPFN